jgi:anti-anti-sigma regulatory factor
MEGAIFAIRSNRIEHFKFSGTVRYSHCAGLESYIDKIFSQQKTNSNEIGFDEVIIDLEEAEILDSTALGLLAKIAIEFKPYSEQKPVIFLRSGELASVLKRVCFDQVFAMVLDKKPVNNLSFSPLVTPELEASETGSNNLSESKTLARVLEAHRCLAELDQKNQSLYQDITAAFKI